MLKPSPKLCPQHADFDIRQFIFQGVGCPHCAGFDEQAFARNWHLPFFPLFAFLRRYVKLDYRTSGGDLVMSMVASEIWLYNIGRQLVRDVPLPDAASLSREEVRRATLPKCNAYSISVALGISPETVRRKVRKLVEQGWVERGPGGELHVTARCEAVFTAESNHETVRDFITTARVLFRQLGLDAPAPRRQGQRPQGSPRAHEPAG